MVFTRRSRPAVDFEDPLPHCDGPKLRSFGRRDSRFKFVSLLSAENSGRHGHVFEVIIDSKRYALKMFNFYDPAEAAGLADLNIPEELVVGHMDPFYAECRAYGRIEENNCNGKVAVGCHGFTSVPADREEELSEAFGVADWHRPSDEYERPDSQRYPFRAIVKELVRDETVFTKKMIRGMRADLLRLRDMLVFVRDVRKENYRGGKLVDFSVSWTAPHLMLSPEIQSQEFQEMDLISELFEFDAMVKDEGISTRVKAVPSTENTRRAQPPRSKHAGAVQPTAHPSIPVSHEHLPESGRHQATHRSQRAVASKPKSARKAQSRQPHSTGSRKTGRRRR